MSKRSRNPKITLKHTGQKKIFTESMTAVKTFLTTALTPDFK